MTTDFATLRGEIVALEYNLNSKKKLLEREVQKCNHQWTGAIADHVYHEGYRIPGDPPGTMGVDWRGPVDVSPKTERRWRRVCRTCGLTQYTGVTQFVAGADGLSVETPKFE
jgi:hypothetical protein